MEQDLQQSDLVCTVDLGGTNLRAANIDRDGRIHERVRRVTPRSKPAEEVVSAIAAAVCECEVESSTRGAHVGGVSVVIPGSVHVETGVVLNAPNIPSLPGFELAPALERALGRPVLLENDANAAALGEMWRGAAREYRTIICLTLGTGVAPMARRARSVTPVSSRSVTLSANAATPGVLRFTLPERRLWAWRERRCPTSESSSAINRCKRANRRKSFQCGDRR